MNEKPEALRIADEIEAMFGSTEIDERTTAELRRLYEENETLKVQRDELLALLNEVRMNFTRDDDLPDDLLPRIDAAIAKVEH